MKKTKWSVLVSMALLLAIVLSACGGSSSSKSASSAVSPSSASQSGNSTAAELPNPIVSYDTLEKAVEALGFSVRTPQWMPDGYTQSRIEVIGGTMLQLAYSKSEDDTITYRVAKGEEDISGDYNEYANEATIEAAGITVTARGDQEEMLSVATWQADGLTYSLGFDKPITAEEIKKIVESLA